MKREKREWPGICMRFDDFGLSRAPCIASRQTTRWSQGRRVLPNPLYTSATPKHVTASHMPGSGKTASKILKAATARTGPCENLCL